MIKTNYHPFMLKVQAGLHQAQNTMNFVKKKCLINRAVKELDKGSKNADVITTACQKLQALENQRAI